MITAIAIDDEPLALEIIRTFSKQTGFIDLKKTFTGTREAMEYVKEQPVELMFLDIHMPGMSGIDFYKAAGQNAMVIFTTAFSEYALEGFNVSAIDYLLKPFKYARFLQACEKAREYKAYLQNKETSDNFLYIRADYTMHKIDFADIQYIEGMDNYIKFHLLNAKPILARMSMKTITEKLPEQDFIRVHRSYIVPVKKITSIKNKVISIGQVEIPVGLNYADKVSGLFS